MAIRDLQHVDEVFQKLIEAELSVAELYAACANAWPEDQAFWNGLANQERWHAEMLRRMLASITHSPTDFDVSRPFNVAAIDAFIKSNREHTAKVKNGEDDRFKALCVGCDLEESLLEYKNVEAVQTANVQYNTMAGEIMTDTRDHRNVMRRRLAKMKAERREQAA